MVLDRDFYIHGFDRNSLVLPGPSPKEHTFIYLDNGEDVMALRAQAAAKDKTSGDRLMPQRVYLVRMKEEGDPFLAKDAGYFVIGGLAGFCFLLWAFIDLPGRLKKDGPNIRLLEMLIGTFLVLLAIRYILKMFA